ncbi:AMP-binding enzyme, partial [Streptomyces violaceorubidus]
RRADQQVKLRGHRIELGEIETVLRTHPAVSQAAVLVRDERLVAYVVGQDTGDLRDHAAQALPAYMVPSAFVTLDDLPLTANGKLDRKALPDPDFDTTTTAEHRAPRTPHEEALCALFADVLGVSRVGIDDDFFDLGGDSIRSLRLVSQARRSGAVFTVRDVFDHRTVAGLAAAHAGSPAVETTPTVAVGADDEAAGFDDAALTGLSAEELERLQAEWEG